MDPQEALARWALRAPLKPAPDAGLINQTWLVGEPPRAVLQWVNPIFDPTIHLDVAAFTTRLRATGLAAPRLVPTAAGELFVAGEQGCWRLWSFLPGRTFHRLENTRQALAAGRLVGRFHAALQGWSYRCRAPRRNIHDTPARMAELARALESADGHALEGPARELGARILARWASWEGELAQPDRLCHGDLKISNLRFDETGERAIALLDLDTLGPMPIASEMGDAWRSWCNLAGEDDPDAAALDLELFEASARAWLAELDLADTERRALVPGIERICLELAARFCADAVRNSYFRENRERHPQPGAHNLLRARGQLALATSARARRARCEAVLGLA